MRYGSAPVLRMILSFVFALALGALAGCGREGEGDEAIVATTTQVADLARNVAGDRTDVTGILSQNSDPHDYEPRPSDAEALAGASVVLTSGGDVDAWAAELIEGSGTSAEVVSLLDAASVVREIDGETDPHWWQDPRNAADAVAAIRDAMISADPAGEEEYAANAAQYVREIRDLDLRSSRCIASLPLAARKLVTSHDSLGYLADRYGIEIVGAAIPALSTQAQPSSGETADLVKLIETAGVPAVFPEAGLPDGLEDAIAGDAGVAVGGELFADSLGEEGTPEGTYLGAFRHNVTVLHAGLSRDGALCPGLEPGP